MKFQHPLFLYQTGKAISFFSCFFYTTLVWADTTDIASSILIKPLPSIQPTLATVRQTPASLPSLQVKEITERIHKSMQRLKQQSTSKNANTRAPIRQTRKLSKKTSPPTKVSTRTDGSVRQIKGGILEPAAVKNTRTKKQRNNATARNFLRRNQRILGLKNPDEELQLVKQHSDSLGREHLRFEQRYKGFPVWPSDIIVHLAPQGYVDLMNGAYAPTPRKPVSLTPLLTEEQAKATALGAVESVKANIEKQAELIFYYSQQSYKLAWKIEVKADINARWMVIVDATNDHILLKFNEVMELATTGSGEDLFNQTQNLPLYEQGGFFYLLDTSKAMFDPSSTPPNPNSTRGGIFLFDAQNQDPNTISFKPSLVSSSQANSGFLPDAVSAAHNISLVYDYYLDRHNRNSIDGNGGSISGIVRVDSDFDNAFWDGELMYFGDGQPYAAALDVVAHEVSHGVTQRSANLVYQGQSGALNEAFSDIFGEMVEARSIGNDWILGTALNRQSQRSFRNPSSLLIPSTDIPYPSTMSEFLLIQQDNGGVHLNSGIINHAYYLLAEGLNNAIGIRDAEQIFYRALTVHLVRNSQFIDARLAAISSADELFGVGSAQSKKTAEAFDRVEILNNIPSTPPPPSTTPINSADSTLFVCFHPNNKVNHLCRRDGSLGDDLSVGVFLTKFDALASRPSVRGDGELATFIDVFRDICFIRTDLDTASESSEACLGLRGTASSVAISPDGKLFGFVRLNSNQQPENFITVVNIGDSSSQPQTFQLVAPAIDASAINKIAFADVMNFTADGRFIIYDALTELRLLDGTAINNWSIYALDMQTGQTSILVSAIPGVDISNPNLSLISDNFMTFALSEEGSSNSSIITANLNSGETKEIGVAGGLFSVPAYNGDDSAVIFDQVDRSAPTGFSLIRQPLSNDHLTASGAADLWLFDAAYGVIYRRGEYQGVLEDTAFYDARAQILSVHAIDVIDNSDQVTTYAANFSVTSFQPLRFRLTAASQTTAQQETGNAVFNLKTNVMTIPRVSLTDTNSNTQVFSVEMNLISNAFDFEVSKLDSIQ